MTSSTVTPVNEAANPRTVRRPFSARSVGLLLAGSVCAGVAAVGVPSNDATLALERHLLTTFGLELTGAESARVALLPTPRISLSGVTIRRASTSGEPALIARDLGIRISFRVLPLWAGRAEPSEILIDHPVLEAVDATQSARNTPSGFGETIATFGAALSASDMVVWPRRIVLNDATVVLHRDPDGDVDQITDVQAALSWTGLDAAVDAMAEGVWRGERIAAQLSSLRPGLLRSQGRSPVKLAVTSSPLSVSVDGSLDRSDASLRGEIVLQADRDPKSLARWLRVALPLTSVLPPMTLDGVGTLTARGLDLEQARLRIADAKLIGSLTAQFGSASSSITGTLATDTIALDALLAGAPALFGPDGNWSRLPFALGDSFDQDVDLRLSAASAQLGGLIFPDAALAIIARSGRLEVNLARSGFENGSLRGRLALSRNGDGLDMRLTGAIEQVDLANMLKSGPMKGWRGIHSAVFALDSTGAQPAELVRNLQGRIQIGGRDGVIPGFDLGDLARRAARAETRDVRGNRTLFDVASANWTIVGGLATTADANLRGPGYTSAIAGEISLLDQQINLTGLAFSSGSGAAPTSPPPIGAPFAILGHLGAPRLSNAAGDLVERGILTTGTSSRR